MAKGSINLVVIAGRLGQDPELKYSKDGAAVCSFSLATDEGYKTKDGTIVEKTEWHRCVAYRKLAEIIGQYNKKGSLISIQGKLQTRNWEKDGQKHYTTEIVASDMTMLGGKSAENAQATPAQARKAAAAKQAPQMEAPDSDIEEDDLPF